MCMDANILTNSSSLSSADESVIWNCPGFGWDRVNFHKKLGGSTARMAGWRGSLAGELADHSVLGGEQLQGSRSKEG